MWRTLSKSLMASQVYQSSRVMRSRVSCSPSPIKTVGFWIARKASKLGVYERVVFNVLLERNPYFAENKTAYVRDRLQYRSNAIDRPASCEETLIDFEQKDIAIPDGAGIGDSIADLQPNPSVLSKKPPPSVKGPLAADVEEIEAITYLSTKYADNGLIRLEYVQRMENAISDTVKLGVSQSFVERCLEPYVHGEFYQPEEEIEEKPSPSDAAVPKTVLEERNRKAKSRSSWHSAASQLPGQGHRAHRTRNKTYDPNLKKQPLGGENRKRMRPHLRTGENGQVSRKEQGNGPTGFWSSVSSMFG